MGEEKSENLIEYQRLAFELHLARAGSENGLTQKEEVEWAEKIADVWNQLSEEEKEIADSTPGTNEINLVDCDVKIGESGREREIDVNEAMNLLDALDQLMLDEMLAEYYGLTLEEFNEKRNNVNRLLIPSFELQSGTNGSKP